jgi:putative glutamine amidotransferase
VQLAEGSRLATIVGARTEIATYHHQAVDRLGAGLVATGWAEDGVVEALELPGRSWVFGVQWHPEAHAGESLFSAFVERCAQVAREHSA